MSLDGMFLRHLKNELNLQIVGRRIYKIYQPSDYEISMSLRGMDDIVKVIISSSADSPRICITQKNICNPRTPPPFCMLLRKKILSAKIVNINQSLLERALYITLETKDEMGNDTLYNLIIEIMGKYSNVILTDNSYKIVDAIKRVNSNMSSKRLVLPGITYQDPPGQDKVCLLEKSGRELAKKVFDFNESKKLSSALLACTQGASNIVCKGILNSIGCNDDVNLGEISIVKKEKLIYQIERLSEIVKNSQGKPYLINLKNGKKDISFIKVEGEDFKEYDTFSKLIDDYYYERAQNDRINSRAGSLIKVIENLILSKSNKIKRQELELKECDDKEKFKLLGDLLLSNIYKIKKGMKSINAIDFLSDFHISQNGENRKQREIKIELDERLNGSENVQKYYKKYKKLKTAQSILLEQIKISQSDVLYLESVLDSLKRSESETEIQDIYDELCDQGYIRSKYKNKRKSNNKEKSYKFIESISPGGYKILIGRNCTQNGILTYKKARKRDLWFHVKDMPGSHTVMFTDGKDVKDEDILFAAKLCAKHSKAQYSLKVEIDYTFISNVKKPNNYKPGMAIYKNYKTICVSPDKIID